MNGPDVSEPYFRTIARERATCVRVAGLESRRARTGFVGSNLTLSATVGGRGVRHTAFVSASAIRACQRGPVAFQRFNIACGNRSEMDGHACPDFGRPRGWSILAAAAFLVTDASMPAEHVTIYESLPLMGGSMDAGRNANEGYTSRGERELEPYMECLWYLCGKVPSLRKPGLTILDETQQANVEERIDSQYRLMEKQGRLYDYSVPLIWRDVESHGDAVAVLPHDASRQCALLVCLFRAPVFDSTGAAVLEEACAGMIGTESAVHAVRREAAEELGVTFTTLEPIATVWSSPGVSTERVFLVLAPYGRGDLAAAGGRVPCEHEHVAVLESPLALLAERVDRGVMADAKLLMLVQALRLRRPALFLSAIDTTERAKRGRNSVASRKSRRPRAKG